MRNSTAKCALDGQPAVGRVDGFLFRRKESTVSVCLEHYVRAKIWELIAQDRVRDLLGKGLRVLGIPKGAIPRIRAHLN